MTSNAIVPENNLRTHESYEQITPVRGCKVSLDNIKEVYSELSRINFEHGQREIANLVKSPDTTDEQWEAHTQNLLENAFRLAISITGEGDQRVYSFDIEIFSSDNLPRQIERIYLDNIVAYKPYANQLEPANKISVMLDFDKPTLLDPHLVVSAATPNESKVHINGTDISFFAQHSKSLTQSLQTEALGME